MGRAGRRRSIVAKIGCAVQTLHEWVKNAEVDSGRRAGVPSDAVLRLNRRSLCKGSFMSSSSVRTPACPGWPEIVAGLAGIAIVGIGGSIWVAQLPLSPVIIGIIFTAMSGVGGLAGFLAAYVLRIRELRAFGIRKTTMRWLLIAVALGIVAFFLKSISILLFTKLTGLDANIQEIYATGGSGGWWSLALATLFLAVLTPIGEEFLFRGVVTTALLRYGPIIAVGGGALIFALFHGINAVFPAALVTGVVAGEIFRRSGSIWPAVVVHSVVNLPTVPTMVAAGIGQ